MQNYICLEVANCEARAWLFDDRAGHFELRGFACEKAVPNQPLSESVQKALAQVKPGNLPLTGYALTLSAGKLIRTVLIGASSDYSLKAAKALASAFYTQIVDVLNLQEGLSVVEQLERLLRTDADLFVVAGGIEEGAEKPVLAALDNLRVMLKAHNRAIPPQIVYLGNSRLKDETDRAFGKDSNFHLGGNICPSLGTQDLGAGMTAMLAAFRRIRRAELQGLSELEAQLNCQFIPVLLAEARMVRFVRQINTVEKDALLISFEPRISTAFISQREKAAVILPEAWAYQAKDKDEPERFNSMLLEKGANLAYLSNKQMHPGFTPVTVEDQIIEQSWFRIALRQCRKAWQKAGYFEENFMPEPVILTGSSLGAFGSHAQLLLAVMDGLELHGITTYVLDEKGVMTALGALAPLNPMIAVQVLGCGLLQNLGTVVTVNSPQKAGQPVLELELRHKFGAQIQKQQILKSELKYLDLEVNTEQKILLHPAEDADLGLGAPGIGGTLNRLSKGSGLIVDARGRPLEMPKDERARAAVVANWLSELGS
ncbi:MAG: glutamate mutase L [Anaerolineaceae bacterium]|nr:glutamate mutase L [Anaerolineaceae bacterium]